MFVPCGGRSLGYSSGSARENRPRVGGVRVTRSFVAHTGLRPCFIVARWTSSRMIAALAPTLGSVAVGVVVTPPVRHEQPLPSSRGPQPQRRGQIDAAGTTGERDPGSSGGSSSARDDVPP